ncbi:MAG TPA: alpha/beta fold hydrolase [Solirubrobacteraceae bacterium]|jgi:pimeloyl-ACP methyl ester carboxylesterase|nr:alpha/beta fold hydrolase [Solirubrobacteraceae bacterium]
MYSTELQASFTEIDGLRVRHMREGAGSPVVVLHGWGASIETVASIVQVLRRIVEVHALDLPGFGESEAPHTPWGVDDYRRFLARFMDAVGVQSPAALIGHSNGGRVAIAMAASEPERVSRMILIDSAGIRPKRTFTYHRKVAMAKVGKHAARRLGAPGRKLRDLLVGRAASADYAAASPQMRPTFVKLVNSDLRELMPQVKAPTLLIWGDGDTATPLADAHLMERLIPDAGLVVLEGAGHFSYLDQPAKFARIAQHFIGEGRTQ